MNWGSKIAWLMIALNIITSGAYFYSRDWRHGFYFLFAALITLTVTV